jgi:hypothetical protein
MAILMKRSNGIYYHITDFHGRRIWKSTGAKLRTEAIQLIKQNFKRPELPIEVSLSQFQQQFIAISEANYAPTTILLYRQVVNTFKRIVGDFHIAAYTVMDVEIFKFQCSKEVSPVKVNIDFRTLRAFFQTALRLKLIDNNPFHGSGPIGFHKQYVFLSRKLRISRCYCCCFLDLPD